jgi:DNA-binding transcriptional regulator YiaG
MNCPTPEQIKQARENAGLTQTQAATLIYKGLRTWQGWEASEGEKGHRKMDAAFWELFMLKVANPEMIEKK